MIETAVDTQGVQGERTFGNSAVYCPGPGPAPPTEHYSGNGSAFGIGRLVETIHLLQIMFLMA